MAEGRRLRRTQSRPKKKKKVAVSAKREGKAVATEDVVDSEAPSEHPSPEVMNLLISTIFADIVHHGTELGEALPDCPYKGKKEVANLLNRVKPFKIQEKLSQTLDNPESDADKLLVYIASKYGTEIVPAEGDLKNPGFSDKVMQFVIVKPRPSIQEAWEKEFAKDRMKSILLFHGTGYPNFQSILRNGFYPCSGVGVFLAAEPMMSRDYASDVSSSRGGITQKWKLDRYNKLGLMFGCEVTGTGRPQATGPGEFHVITRLKSVIPRYIFLFTVPSVSIRVGLAMPKRAAVDPEMTEGSRKSGLGLRRISDCS